MIVWNDPAITRSSFIQMDNDTFRPEFNIAIINSIVLFKYGFKARTISADIKLSRPDSFQFEAVPYGEGATDFIFDLKFFFLL